MSAPTNVAVEATSITTNEVYWDYTGTASIGVYRATPNDSGYSLINTVGSGITNYTDTGLTPGTRYFYKLSDDVGGTFSASVSTITHTCADTDGSVFMLPRFDGSDQQSGNLNILAESVENFVGSNITDIKTCDACPADGAVVIDCTNGCTDWVVVADQDINSVSVINCDPQANIDFIIPPNTTRRIGGFPGGKGFGADHFRRMPIVTGAKGATAGVQMKSGTAKKSASKTGYGGGGGGSGSGCTCVPHPVGGGDGGLTIKSCNAGNSLGCAGPAVPRLMLKVCGGRGPYTWSLTGSVKFQGVAGDRSTDKTSVVNPIQDGTPSVVVLPAVNAGSGTAGNAYTKQGQYCDAGTGLITPLPAANTFGCNDQVTIVSTCSGATICSGVGSVLFASGVNANCTSYPIGSIGAYCQQQDGICDVRSAPMIAAGCVPCGVSAGSSTISVTDGAGVTVTVVLSA